jgi:ABC-2 type transport system permease protein
MRLLDLAIKDLSQVLRDRRSLLFIVAMPVVFTLFMGFAYGSSGQNQETADSRIPLAVVDPEPNAQLNRMLLGWLTPSDAIKVSSMPRDEAMSCLEDGKVAGVLVLPAGLSEKAEAGEQVQLQLIAKGTSSEGQSLYQLLRVPISQLMSSAEVARISAEVRSDPDEYAPALAVAWAKWAENAEVELVRTEQVVGEAAGASDWMGGNPYNQASPGIMVMFAIFSLINSAMIVLDERKTGTLQRLMSTAMRPWEIVAGHLLAMFTLTFMQMILLVLFGQIALRVDYMREPVGILLVCLALGLWVGSMGLLIGVVAKAEDQVILFSLVAMFLFSALGGTWFPLEVAGGAFAAIGRLTPTAWAMNGLQNILIRGQGLESVWVPVGVLLLYAVGFFALAVWRFRRIQL